MSGGGSSVPFGPAPPPASNSRGFPGANDLAGKVLSYVKGKRCGSIVTQVKTDDT